MQGLKLFSSPVGVSVASDLLFCFVLFCLGWGSYPYAKPSPFSAGLETVFKVVLILIFFFLQH
jgi:hypothetical protein